jgi:hypothetical protein
MVVNGECVKICRSRSKHERIEENRSSPVSRYCHSARGTESKHKEIQTA